MSSDDEVFSEDSLEDSSGSDIFSEAESSDLEELFDSDSGDEHFEGFGFSMPDNRELKHQTFFGRRRHLQTSEPG